MTARPGGRPGGSAGERPDGSAGEWPDGRPGGRAGRLIARAQPGVPLDAVGVGLFVAIGRRSHDDDAGLAGFLRVAAPFLIGVAIGWLIVGALAGGGSMGRGRSGESVRSARPGYSWRSGWPVWVTTVVVGMMLRQVTGRGTAASFVIVTTLFLGALMLGWRVVLGRRLTERS